MVFFLPVGWRKSHPTGAFRPTAFFAVGRIIKGFLILAVGRIIKGFLIFAVGRMIKGFLIFAVGRINKIFNTIF